jgi:hypothetical protein
LTEVKPQPLIERCLVCGESFPADVDFCAHCETPRHVLVDVVTARTQPHFLFGSLGKLEQAPGDGAVSQQGKRPGALPFARGAMRPEGGQQSAALPGHSGASLPACPPVRRAVSGENPGRLSSWALLLDLLLCGTMNGLVFLAICLVSGRSWRELVQSSLIPVSLVMICFTVLYFWLFLGLLQRTLGQIISGR